MKNPKTLKNCSKKIISDQHFTRFELQHRNTESKIKKSHYKFFYNPVHKTQSEEDHVLLDILFEKPNYQQIIELPIKSKFVISNEDEITVKLPSKNDILGDKLTAFAPNTAGIPYFKNDKSMSMEIMKQLYDIAGLVDIADNMEILRATFKSFSKTELNYRNRVDLNHNDVIEDVIQTALAIVSRGAAGNGNFEEIKAGIQRVSRFIFSEPFHLDKAITMASKAAYIASLIKYNSEEIVRFDNPLQMKEWEISDPMWPKLNRLKKSNPEAFFYWYKIHEIIQKNRG
jgi:hypothetical protein